MSQKKAPPLTVEAVRKELEKRPMDDPTREEAWSNLPILILCERSPEDAPKIIERVLRADAPATLADALRTDGNLLREILEFLDTKAPEWRDLRDALSMFEEAKWLQQQSVISFPKRAGRGRKTNTFALERETETWRELREIKEALIAEEHVPHPYPPDEFLRQLKEIKKRRVALDRMKDNSSAKEYQEARTALKIGAFLRAAIVWLDAVGLPHTEGDAARLVERLKKSRRAFRRLVAPPSTE